jgi:hypothetical protein
VFGEIAPKMKGAGSQSFGAPPAGTILDWWQADTFVSVPIGWALCNGQPAVWETGPRAGQSFTTPNFIGMYDMGGDLLAQANVANASGYGNLTPQTAVGFTAGTTSGNSSYTYAQNYQVYAYAALNGHTHTFGCESSALICARIIKL